MKNYFAISLFFFLFLEYNTFAQAPNIQWQRCLGGSGFESSYYSSQPTSDGGFILHGHTFSNDGDVSGNHGEGDIWIVKLSDQGTIQWQRCLGGSGTESSTSLQQTSDGGFIMQGYTSSNDGDVSGNHGVNDLWVVKLSAQGNIQWQRCLGGSNNEGSLYSSSSLQQTSDGGFIMQSYTNSNDGDVSGNHGGGDIWVVKISAQGTIQWQRCLGGSGYEHSDYSLQQTSDGEFIVQGYTDSNDGDVSGNHGGSDIWVVKLSAQGTIQWQRCLGSSDNERREYSSLRQTSDGGVILHGNTEFNDGDISGNHGGGDIWVVKLSAQGTIQWQKCLGGSSTEKYYYSSLQETSDRGFIMQSYTYSNDGDVSGNHGGGDIWVVKLSTQGNIQWQKCLGGYGYEGADYTSLQQTSDRGFIMQSYTQSNDGDVSGNHGGRDIWVVKLSAQGTIQWQRCLGGSDYERSDYSFQQTIDGGFIVQGHTMSNDGDVSGNNGGSDLWVVKLSAQGTIQWQRCLGSSGNERFDYSSLQQTSDGGFIVQGNTEFNDGDILGNHGMLDIWVVKLGSLQTTEHFHQVNDNPIFAKRKLLLSNPSPFSLNAKICADGSEASIFKISGGNQNYISINARIKDATNDETLYGKFNIIHRSRDSLIVKYKHPEYITGNGKSTILKLEFYDESNVLNVIATNNIEIFRVPIVFVHGLTANTSTFQAMANSLINDYKLYESSFIKLVSYESTNTSSFFDNRNVVPNSIDALLDLLRQTNISSGKVACIGHSMGGILSRLYIQNSSTNPFKGDIQKLITINTPHSGSHLPCKLNASTISTLAHLKKLGLKYSCDCQAFENLSVESSAIRLYLNGENLNANLVPSHAIATRKPLPDLAGLAIDRLQPYPTQIVPFLLMQYDINYTHVFGGDTNDWVASYTSQLGGLPTNSTSTVEEQIHRHSTDNIEVIEHVVNLLKVSSTSSSFCQNGFAPPILSCDNPIISEVNKEHVETNTPQTTILVNTFEKGMFILNAQNFNIKTNGLMLSEITAYVSYKDDSVLIARQAGNVANFSMPINYQIPDKREIVIVGKTSTGEYISVNTSDTFCETIKSGNWDDASTWKHNIIPTKNDVVLLNATHTLTVRTKAKAKAILTTSGKINFTNIGSLVIE